jgi:hypothetical protein
LKKSGTQRLRKRISALYSEPERSQNSARLTAREREHSFLPVSYEHRTLSPSPRRLISISSRLHLVRRQPAASLFSPPVLHPVPPCDFVAASASCVPSDLMADSGAPLLLSHHCPHPCSPQIHVLFSSSRRRAIRARPCSSPLQNCKSELDVIGSLMLDFGVGRDQNLT